MWGCPFEIETGRYGVNRVPAEERLCVFCEDEFHVVIKCSIYGDIWDTLFDKINTVNSEFTRMSDVQQFKYIHVWKCLPTPSLIYLMWDILQSIWTNGTHNGPLQGAIMIYDLYMLHDAGILLIIAVNISSV